MSDVAAVKAAKHNAAEQSRHEYELKRLKQKNYNEWKRLSDAKEDEIVRVQKDYGKLVDEEKNSTTRKLNEFRIIYSERKKEEQQRLEKELVDLRKAHKEQVEELKETHAKEIQNMDKSHREYLETAQKKFEAEKAKANG